MEGEYTMKKVNLNIPSYTNYIKGFSREICQIDNNHTKDNFIKKAENYFKNYPIKETVYGHEARVWVLIGIKYEQETKDEIETSIMVAQAENISKEIIPHIRSMFKSKEERTTKMDTFYGNAMDIYDKLVFYEIIIDEYLKEENKNEMYELYKDYYCEALLAIELKVNNWQTYRSGISKRIYRSLQSNLKDLSLL